MIIETDRILLRNVNVNDFESVKNYLTDEYVMRFFDHGVMPDKDIIEFCLKESEMFVLVYKPVNKVIGHIAFHDWVMKDTYEIGWVLNKEYHNQGLITEIAKSVIKYAFVNLKAHRVIATVQPENIASNRVCKKLGFRKEGLFKKCIYVARLDEWWDEVFYAILAEEYKGSEME